jgi:O-antigen/teichoic acid export membrane protein
VARTALANLLIIGANTVAGILAARTLGPEGRGHFAAISAWFGLSLVVGELGQSAAVTYHVSRWPLAARNVIASARTLMLALGLVTALAGLALAEQLAHGDPEVAWAYRVVFLGCVVNSGFASFTYAIQAVDIGAWNVVRGIQPVGYLVTVSALFTTQTLTLLTLGSALILSILVQGMLSAAMCHRRGLLGGNLDRGETRRLARYGAAQSASSIPASFGSQIDKIALSRAADPASLGVYAVAMSVLSLGAPLATAVGSVVFPRLSRSDIPNESRRATERASVLVSASGLAFASAGVAAVAPLLVPLLFGPGFDGAVPLVWWLVPSTVAGLTAIVVGDLLRARGRPGLVAVAQMSGVLVSGTGILFLTSAYGLVGTALAVGAGQSTCLAISLLALRRAAA